MSSNNTSGMYMNMPKGTSFQDGVRVGPYFSQPQPTSFDDTTGFPVVNPAGGVTTRQALGNMSAPGALLAPLLTVALAPNASAAPAAHGNICNVTPATGIFAKGWIPLSAGDGKATTLRQVAGSKYEGVIKSSFAGKALKFLEMDYPRCVTATLAAAAPVGGQAFDVYGLDMYGQPLTSRIEIEAGTPSADSTSAFAVVFGVQVITAMANTVRVAMTASNKNFGLPYYLPSDSCVAYGGGYTTDGAGANPEIITGVAGFVPFGAEPTVISADVRGTLSLKTAIDSITYLYAGVYCPGFDNMINHLNAAGASNVETPVTMSMQYGQVPYFNFQTAQGLVQMVNPVAAEAPVVKAEPKAEVAVKVAEVKKK